MSSNTPSFNMLINNITRIARSASRRNDKLQKICRLLKEGVPHYDWVGFYLADNDNKELVLGPFEGAPTEHIKIPFGKGICGQAAESNKTFIVQDVSSETNYLSCSADVKSEIVLPIMKHGRFIGELDIDSHQIGPFTDEDEQFLKNVCEIVAQLI